MLFVLTMIYFLLQPYRHIYLVKYRFHFHELQVGLMFEHMRITLLTVGQTGIK